VAPQDYAKALKSENQQPCKSPARKPPMKVTSQLASKNLQLLISSLNHFLEAKLKKVSLMIQTFSQMKIEVLVDSKENMWILDAQDFMVYINNVQ